MKTDVNPMLYFQDSLDAWMDAQAKAEQREERIAQRATAMLQPDGDYYPWTFDHYQEAMTEAPESSRRLVWMFLVGALKPNPDDRTSAHVLNSIKSLVEEYWEELATWRATCDDDRRDD